MYKKRLVALDTYYVGASERRLALFENDYPLRNGVSYNSYIILDEKTCLLDTTDKSVDEIFFKKIEDTLEGRNLDFIVVDHMEPDHAGTLHEVIKRYENATVIMNDKILAMYKNYNNNETPNNLKIVKEGDVVELGKHKLTFVNAPMVHWPEVMMTYDTTSKTLFSADAFGTFGALSGNLFADEVDFEHEFLEEARRYYCNIVGKYGTQVQAVLNKASTIEIKTICPLHGPIWRENLKYIIDLYDKWSSYEPEVEGALIVYGNIYGHIESVANLVADNLSLNGVKDIKLYDVSKTHKSYLVAEAFKYSHLIILSSTYNMGIFTPMAEFLEDIKAHNLQNRKFAVIENGSWAPNSGKLILEILNSMPKMTQIGEKLTIRGAYKDSDKESIDNLSKLISDDFKTKPLGNPLFNISYGLYVLTSNDGTKDNGCIINTLSQVANNPDRIMVCVNKANYSAETIYKTKKCNVSILNKNATFDIFKLFGFQSGKKANKFDGFENYKRSSNGLTYITLHTNSFISLDVKEIIDLGSHYGFVCEIGERETFNNVESLTYGYYQSNVKPKPKVDNTKHGWRCKICGYIYEGEVLPPDYICPLCKHPASDFEKI